MPSTDDDRGCPKCGHTEVQTDKISTTGGGLTKIIGGSLTLFVHRLSSR